jgi:hypothetical protein
MPSAHFFKLFSSFSFSLSSRFPFLPVHHHTGKITTTTLPQHYNTMPSSTAAAATGSRLLPWGNMGAYILNIAATYVIGTTGKIGKTNSEGNYRVPLPPPHVLASTRTVRREEGDTCCQVCVRRAPLGVCLVVCASTPVSY